MYNTFHRDREPQTCDLTNLAIDGTRLTWQLIVKGVLSKAQYSPIICLKLFQFRNKVGFNIPNFFNQREGKSENFSTCIRYGVIFDIFYCYTVYKIKIKITCENIAKAINVRITYRIFEVVQQKILLIFVFYYHLLSQTTAALLCNILFLSESDRRKN